MNRRKLALILGAGFVVLLIGGILAHWQYYEYLTNAELERIRAAGEPLNIEEVREYYCVAAGDFAHEADWLEVFAEMKRVGEANPQFTRSPFHLGYSSAGFSVVGRPWPEVEQAEAFLRSYATALTLARKAAVRPGPVRSTLKSIQETQGGENLLADEVHHLKNLLLLESSVHIHRGEPEAAANDLMVLLALGRCLEFDPNETGCEARFIVDTYALKQVVKALSAIRMSDASLEKLQQAIREIRYERHYYIALLAERLLEYERVGWIFEGWSYGISHEGTDTICTGSPRSHYAYLATMREMIAAGKLDWPQMRVATAEAARRVGKPFRLPFIQRPIHRIEDVRGDPPYLADWVIRAVARTRAADAVIAVERYRRRSGRLPQSLEELTPQFLPAVPRDPIDGKPLRYRLEDDAVSIYSIGTDEADDGSTPEAFEKRKDVGYRVPFQERP